jgi:hypothetical protein
MDWSSAEIALRAHIEGEWAASPYAAVPLVFENELDDPTETFIVIDIEGTYAEKSIFGSLGLRSSIEAGIVFFHAFTPLGSGKSTSVAMIETMTNLLELRSVAPGINTDGGNPPSPVEVRSMFDRDLPRQQPNGNYYRCSGSVPFIVIGVR